MSAVGIHNDTHAKTTRLNIHEVARQLVSHLGPTLVAYLANVNDRKLPHKWAKVNGPEPRQESTARLLAAHRIWNDISNSESDGVARSWFIGANPRLGEDSPAAALRDGREKAVLAAARAFIEGTDD